LLRDSQERQETKVFNGMLKSELSFEQEQFEMIPGCDRSDENEKLSTLDRSSRCSEDHKSTSSSSIWQNQSTTAKIDHKPSSSEVILVLKEMETLELFSREVEDNQQFRIFSDHFDHLQQDIKFGEGSNLIKQRSKLDIFSKSTVKSVDLKVFDDNAGDRVFINNPAVSNTFKPLNTSSKKTFKCKICSKVLATKNYLRKHFVSMHTGHKNFTCDYCSKSVFHKHHMIYHMKLHMKDPDYKDATSDKQRPFKCHLCPRYFETFFVLQQHQISHSCKNLVQLLPSVDKKLITVFSDFRPFRCWCGSSFKTKGILKTHQKNIHREDVKKWMKKEEN
jgi:hypothetical protein